MDKIDPKIDASILLLFCFGFYFSSGNHTKLIILLHNNNKGIHRQQQHAVQQDTQQPTGAMAAIVFGSAFENIPRWSCRKLRGPSSTAQSRTNVKPRRHEEPLSTIQGELDGAGPLSTVMAQRTIVNNKQTKKHRFSYYLTQMEFMSKSDEE
jgi:hypothetical protein